MPRRSINIANEDMTGLPSPTLRILPTSQFMLASRNDSYFQMLLRVTCFLKINRALKIFNRILKRLGLYMLKARGHSGR